ncbi:MAG: hypothetical protein AAF557_05460 [Pseudomonadota bacterium]
MNSVQKFTAYAVLFLSATAVPVAAEPHPISETINNEGLAAAERQLAQQTDLDASERFALGGVRFLRGIENATQQMWRYQIQPKASSIPLLRLPIPKNYEPEPFKPEQIADLFKQALKDMEAADQQLAAIQDADEVSFTVSLDHIWFDVNANGQRDQREGLLSFLGMFGRQIEGQDQDPIITFDTSDAAWLAAYANLISASSHAVLAFDPSEPIARINAAEDKIRAATGEIPANFIERPTLNYFAIVIQSIEQQPDRNSIASVERHLRAMLAHNKIFWTRVAAETDDANEWIPSDRQTSALGLVFPKGLGETWLAVLSDIEKVLDGDLLIPHPLLGRNGGINLAKYFADPSPIDVSAWLHGHGVVTYLDNGELISGRSWEAFQRLVSRRDAMQYAMILN